MYPYAQRTHHGDGRLWKLSVPHKGLRMSGCEEDSLGRFLGL